jgi:chromosome segregation ATPase
VQELKEKLQQQADQLQGSEVEWSEQMRQLRCERDSFGEAITQLEQKLLQYQQSVEEKDTRLSTIAQEKSELERRLNLLLADSEQLAATVAEKQAQLQETRMDVEVNKKTVEALQECKQQLLAEVDSLKSLLNEGELLILFYKTCLTKVFDLGLGTAHSLDAQQKDTIESLESQHRDLKVQLDNQHQSIQSKLNANTALESELSEMKLELMLKSEELSFINEQLTSTTGALQQRQEIASQLEQIKNELATKCKDLTAELDAAKTECTKLAMQSQEYATQVETLATENAKSQVHVSNKNFAH